MSITPNVDDAPPPFNDSDDVPPPDDEFDPEAVFGVDPYADVQPDDVDPAAVEEPKKRKKRLGLPLSDTAPDELFDAYVIDTDTGMERETSLEEIRKSPLNAPALTVEATEKLVGGAITAAFDGRLRRDRNGTWWVASINGWVEVHEAEVLSILKSMIGRPDAEDKATRAIIPFTYRKPTKADLEYMDADDDPSRPIPEPADKWAESTDTARRIRADIEGRKSVHLPQGFDTNPLLLNAGGLVIDLSPSIVDEIEARPLSRHDLISRSMRTKFDPEATCPAWERFVAEIMSYADPDTGVITRRPEMERFLQITAGLTLIGEVIEQIVLVYHGQLGSNGKSVYANALRYVFGTYSTTLPKAALMEKRGESHTTDLTVLEGARFGYAKETKRTRWDAEQLKDLASREAYSARKLYENNREITPSHTLHIGTNNLPLLPSGDAAVWRRVKIVEFKMRWYAEGDREEDKAVSVGPIDPDLPTKLEAEASGILNWVLDGLRMYYADGALKVPDDVRRATESARRSSSLWAEFLVEHFELTDEDADVVTVADIWKLWNAYKAENSQHQQLAPTGIKDVQNAFETEMPSAKFVGREEGKRKVAIHFKRAKLTDTGVELKAALVGNASAGGVVVPFTSNPKSHNSPAPFGDDKKESTK